jgi:hypothetical protein
MTGFFYPNLDEAYRARLVTAYGDSIGVFAAERGARLNDFDGEIRGIVERALENYGADEWYAPIVEGAGVLWSEIFERESPTGEVGAALATFLRELGESLAKTAEPDQPPTKAQVDRVVNWVGVYSVNSATYFAARDSDQTTKTWLSMDDDAVRPAHRAVDGQSVEIMGTFDVGGSKLHFPGEPVGPPEVWINCRCLLAVTGGPEMGTKTTSFAAKAEEDEDLDGIEDVEDERELTDEELNSGELVDDETETPWHGVLVVEGTPTGDKRQFDTGALSYADFPMPITYQRASADGHSGSVVVGRIDKIWKEEGSNEHRATGMFNLNVAEAHEVIDGLVFGMLGGVSVDVDSSEFYLEFEETTDDKDDEEAGFLELMFGGDVKLTHFTAGRIRSASIVQIPAFAEAYIALGPDFEATTRDPEAGAGGADGEVDAGTEDGDEFTLDQQEALAHLAAALDDADLADLDEAYALTAAAFAPGTKDGPGWITHPRATQRLRNYWVHGKGAAKIRWGVPGDFNRCRRQLAKYVNPAFLAGTCANMHKEALKVWPGRERGDKNAVSTMPSFSLVASAGPTLKGVKTAASLDDPTYFANPKLERITPLTVDEDGWVYGHLAVWGTCHIGIDGVCTMPPVSATQYAFFATGQVLTTDGFVNTGRITLGTGHAGLHARIGDARQHYDNTGRAVADIAVYEDGIGIAFAGRIREDAAPPDVKTLRASALSGDWRRTNMGGLELIGVLAVNAGGYPTPRFAMDGDTQISLIASAGMLAPARERKVVLASAYIDDAETLHAIGRVVADELEYRQDRRARLSAARDPELLEAAGTRRAARLAAAKTLEE